MKAARYLDYAIAGNLIFPVLFLDSDQFLQIVDDCDSGKMEMRHKLRARKRGA